LRLQQAVRARRAFHTLVQHLYKYLCACGRCPKAEYGC
jgi:hypothetical protein